MKNFRHTPRVARPGAQGSAGGGAPEQAGRHGLVVSASNQRGLLLPQVPLEHGWDRTTFLEQTCKKAGLPTDAWQQGATLEAFTAEVFGDRES